MKEIYPKLDEKETRIMECETPSQVLQSEENHELPMPNKENEYELPPYSTPEKVSDKGSLSSENEAKKLIIDEQSSIHSLQSDTPPYNDNE